MYTPNDLTLQQTKIIIRASERYGIGVAFMPSRIRSNVLDCRAIAALGYMRKTSTGYSCNAFYLTDKALPVIDANN